MDQDCCYSSYESDYLLSSGAHCQVLVRRLDCCKNTVVQAKHIFFCVCVCVCCAFLQAYHSLRGWCEQSKPTGVSLALAVKLPGNWHSKVIGLSVLHTEGSLMWQALVIRRTHHTFHAMVAYEPHQLVGAALQQRSTHIQACHLQVNSTLLTKRHCKHNLEQVMCVSLRAHRGGVRWGRWWCRAGRGGGGCGYERDAKDV